MYLFSLANTHKLAKQICKNTKFKLGVYHKKHLSDGEQYLQVKNKIKNQTVYVVGSTCQPDNNILELLLLINALKENQAKKIILIIPYFGYSRQDKIDRPGAPITAKLIAQLFKQAGVNKFITVDIHSKRNQKYLSPNLINLTPFELFTQYIKKNLNLKDTIIVAPDNGAKPRAQKLTRLLGNLPVIVMQKIRPKQNIAKIIKFEKNITNKNIIIIDDMIDTAGTIIAACNELKKQKVNKIYIFATHGILSGQAIKRLKKAPIKQIVLTDTHPLPAKKLPKKFKILPITKLIINKLK